MILAVLAQNVQLIKDIAFLVAIANNIIILISFKRDSSNEIQYDNKGTINVFGIIIIILSSIIVLYFLARTAPLLIRPHLVGLENDIKTFRLFKIVKRILFAVFALLQDFQVIYYILYAMCAIVGLVVSPFFFFFHLFDILVRYPVLLNVVKSVWNPRKQICYTFFLFLCNYSLES